MDHIEFARMGGRAAAKKLGPYRLRVKMRRVVNVRWAYYRQHKRDMADIMRRVHKIEKEKKRLQKIADKEARSKAYQERKELQRKEREAGVKHEYKRDPNWYARPPE